MHNEDSTSFIRNVLIALTGFYEKFYTKPGETSNYGNEFIRRTVNYFSYLDLKFPKAKFPYNTLSLIEYLSKPMIENMEIMPKELADGLRDENFDQFDEMMQKRSDYYFIDDSGFDCLNSVKYQKILDSDPQIDEFNSQFAFNQIVKGSTQKEYEFYRSFLTSKENLYFSTNKIEQSDMQLHYLENEKFKSLMPLLYRKVSIKSKRIKCCPICGAPLEEIEAVEKKEKSYICSGSKHCNEMMNNKTADIKVLGDVENWVMNPFVIHSIYTPGQLENDINYVLKKNGITPSRWPNLDQWDFEFEINGQRYYIDAKTGNNERMIIEDVNQHLEQLTIEKVIYIIPNYRNINFTRTVDNNFSKYSQLKYKPRCFRLKEFSEYLESEKNNDNQ